MIVHANWMKETSANICLLTEKKKKKVVAARLATCVPCWT